MGQNQFPVQPWKDPVCVFAMAISAGAFGVGLFFLLTPQSLLYKLLLPLAVSIYSSDGIVEAWGLNQFSLVLKKTGPISLLISVIALGYAFLWHHASSRLPNGQPKINTAQPATIAHFELCLLLLATLIIPLLLRIRAMTRGLTYDEIFSAIHFINVDSMWKTISSYISFNNHIAYSVLARTSQLIFGNHEWALRLPALLLGIATIYCVWFFVRHFFGRDLALLAALGLAISPAHTIWSTAARGYSGMILFTAISSYLFLKLLDRPSVRDALMFVMASVLGIYFHLYAAAVTLVQILFVIYLAVRESLRKSSPLYLCRESFRVLWVSFGAIVGLAIIFYAPVLPQLVLTLVQQDRSQFNPLFPIMVLRELSAAPEAPLLVLLLLVVMLGWVFLRKRHREAVDYFALLLILPLIAASSLRPYFLFARFFAYFLPYYVLFLASGLLALWQFTFTKSKGSSRYLTLGVLSILAAVIVFNWLPKSWANMGEDGFKETAQAVQSSAKESTGFCALGGIAELYQYYTTMRIVNIRSMNEFEQFSKNYTEIMCAYYDVPSPRESTDSKELRSFLSKRSQSQKFGTSVLFIYSKVDARKGSTR